MRTKGSKGMCSVCLKGIKRCPAPKRTIRSNEKKQECRWDALISMGGAMKSWLRSSQPEARESCDLEPTTGRTDRGVFQRKEEDEGDQTSLPNS